MSDWKAHAAPAMQPPNSIVRPKVASARLPCTTGLAGSRAYGPLGTVVANANLVGNLGYQSGFTESSTGRVNMGARWYNPNTGQFDNRDIAFVRVSSTGRASGIVTGTESTNVYDFTDGKIKRIRIFFDRSEALKAVELAE